MEINPPKMAKRGYNTMMYPSRGIIKLIQIPNVTPAQTPGSMEGSNTPKQNPTVVAPKVST